MATSAVLASELSGLLHTRPSTCLNTYKQLQAARMVSAGGRGRNAPPVSASDCVHLLLAVLGSEHLHDAAGAARRYGGLVARYRSAQGPSEFAEDERTRWFEASRIFTSLYPIKAKHCLADALIALVSDYASPSAVSIKHFAPEVVVTMNGPEIFAAVRIADAKVAEEIEYRPSSSADMFRMVGRSNDLRIRKTITASTFAALGKLLRDE